MPQAERTSFFGNSHSLGEDNGMSAFGGSERFKRGWTLQELLAPPMLVFYDVPWEEIGIRRNHQNVIGQIMSIQCNFDKYGKASVAQENVMGRSPADFKT